MLQAYCSLKGNYALCMLIKDLENAGLSLRPSHTIAGFNNVSRLWSLLGPHKKLKATIFMYWISSELQKRNTYFPAVSCLPSLLWALETVPLMLQQPTAQSPNVVFHWNMTLFPSEKSTHTQPNKLRKHPVQVLSPPSPSALLSYPKPIPDTHYCYHHWHPVYFCHWLSLHWPVGFDMGQWLQAVACLLKSVFRACSLLAAF